MSQEFASQASPCRQAWAQHWAVKESRVQLQSFLCPKLRDDVIISAASYWPAGSNKFCCFQSLNLAGVLGARWTADGESTCSEVALQLIWKAAARRE